MEARLCTPAGSRRYAAKLQNKTADGHFRLWPRIADSDSQYALGSLGLGTYTGESDEQTDLAYEQALITAIRSGVNVVDCSINYRHMRSERAIGRAVQSLIADGTISRDEIWIMSKGGYLPFDGQLPANPGAYLRDTYMATGILPADQIVSGCHSIDPTFLTNQLKRSLDNFGLDGLDVYFLHNPEEQLKEIPRAEFMLRLTRAFHVCERAVKQGQIRYYGLATWDGFRVPSTHRQYLDLNAILGIARSVGGEDHHFRALQLPFNLAMMEAMLLENQLFAEHRVPTLEAAFQNDMLVVTSVPLMQTRILEHLPPDWALLMPELRFPAQRALQFIRSIPGIAAPLVGMKSPDHVEQNCQLSAVAPLSPERFQIDG